MDREEPESPAPAPPPHPDPEIAALLDFAPVVRRCKRHDGWTHENQRDFIIGLAETGSTDQAAVRLGRTASGAWKVRKSAGGEGFDAAWDAALALYDSRNPRAKVAPSGKGGRWARHQQRPAPRPKPSAVNADGSPSDAALRALDMMPPEAEDMTPEEALEIVTLGDMMQPLIDKYVAKLREERTCRLAGRIVEADFAVRQLTAIEIQLDLGGAAGRQIDKWRLPDDLHMIEVAATPMSVLLAGIRRDYWAEKGEPERPPLAPLGVIEGGVARGESIAYSGGRDGDYKDWRRRQDDKHRFAAEAQKAWEEKARADAAESAAREGRAE
jgi:hypothetical protein